MEGEKINNAPDSSEAKGRDKSLSSLYSVIYAIIAIWGIYLAIPFMAEYKQGHLPQRLFVENGHISLSIFGDYFGALNCLFAGLAFAAVYISIKQQSQSINIQQNELKAQLEEAREQTKLQIKFQFSEEFYRRINLLKAIEHDISYNNEKGLDAIVPLASNICQLLTYIEKNDCKEACKYYRSHMHQIRVALDKFKVWGNTFLALTDGIFTHHNECATYEKPSAKDPDAYTKIEAERNNAIQHYLTILIASTIWGEQYLLLLLYYRSDNLKITQMLKHPDFARGAKARLARNPQHQELFHWIYFIDKEKKLEEEIAKICQKYHEEQSKPSPEELAPS